MCSGLPAPAPADRKSRPKCPHLVCLSSDDNFNVVANFCFSFDLSSHFCLPPHTRALMVSLNWCQFI